VAASAPAAGAALATCSTGATCGRLVRAVGPRARFLAASQTGFGGPRFLAAGLIWRSPYSAIVLAMADPIRIVVLDGDETGR
ncbi:MAG: hypothetical protein M3071_15330, partial [Actinomycetota bacterium]|nr:hypothetical protein [Actinomycetota bacterium]